MARHRDHLRGWFWVLPSLAIPLVVSWIAWAGHVANEGTEIAANVRFAGIDVSGLPPEVAAEHVGWRELDFLETPVRIDLGERTVRLTAREIGYDYLYIETVEALVSARHGEGPWSEFASWVSTPFETVTVADRFVLDEASARERLGEDDFVLDSPVEPDLVATDGVMTVVPGVDGVGVDVDRLIDELASAAIASGPVEIVAEHAAIPPTVNDSVAEQAAARVNEETEHGLAAAVGLTAEKLDPTQVRQYIIADVLNGEITVSFDLDGLQQEIEGHFQGPRGKIQKPILRVVDGVVEVAEKGKPPPVCCSTESVKEMAEAVLDEGAPIYVLDTRRSEDETMLAWANGSLVVEPVAEFTTHHACCQNRVTNIHAIADRIRGLYLIPGETISFNEYVGRRTRAKGYVPAGAIRGGYTTDEVGGGISQFVTTMFNAAFFAGLELDEYRSHSIYFSRYPFGREATLSMPGPDLVLTNTTEYPVLVWPTYDDTSITVTIYSTEHIEVEEIDHRVTYRGQCRHSEIDRQRTYPDGRVIVDTIVANYRPGDGIDCNGDVIPPRD